MRQSNGYIIFFTVLLTVVCAGLLAGVAEGLKPEHAKQIELDTKSQILGAVMDMSTVSKDQVDALYSKSIRSFVVDINGEEVKTIDGKPAVAEKINVRKEYKKSDKSQKYFPVFEYLNEQDPSKVEAYILPVYGNGLWDNIWGYVAIESDFNTIKGCVFDHKAETPGLGARITEKPIQDRFKGKKLYDEQGNFKSVALMKGEGHVVPATNYHEVDGLSGATMTSNGLNTMLKDYFTYYNSFFEKQKSKVSAPKVEAVVVTDSTASVQVVDSSATPVVK